MAFPRAAALTELVWSPAVERDFADFSRRLPAHLARLDGLDVNYRPPGDDELSFWGKCKYWLLMTLVNIHHWYTDL